MHMICRNQICIWTQYEIYLNYRINVCINNILFNISIFNFAILNLLKTTFLFNCRILLILYLVEFYNHISRALRPSYVSTFKYSWMYVSGGMIMNLIGFYKIRKKPKICEVRLKFDGHDVIRAHCQIWVYSRISEGHLKTHSISQD